MNILDLFNQSAFSFGKTLFDHHDQGAAVQGCEVRVEQVLSWRNAHQTEVVALGRQRK